MTYEKAIKIRLKKINKTEKWFEDRLTLISNAFSRYYGINDDELNTETFEMVSTILEMDESDKDKMKIMMSFEIIK